MSKLLLASIFGGIAIVLMIVRMVFELSNDDKKVFLTDTLILLFNILAFLLSGIVYYMVNILIWTPLCLLDLKNYMEN